MTPGNQLIDFRAAYATDRAGFIDCAARPLPKWDAWPLDRFLCEYGGRYWRCLAVVMADLAPCLPLHVSLRIHQKPPSAARMRESRARFMPCRYLSIVGL